jgi:hypothetical protein
MSMQEGAFQNLVLLLLNDINATNKEISKFQSRELALLEAIKDNLYAKNVEAANAIIEQLYETYQKMSEANIQTCKDMYNKELILPRWPQQ